MESIRIVDVEAARRLESGQRLLRCCENGDGPGDTPCRGETRVYRTSIGTLPLCRAHSQKAFAGEGISDDAMESLGLDPRLSGETVMLRVPLAELWHTHEIVAQRLRRLGLITQQCAATPCQTCNGSAPAGRCVCPCHDNGQEVRS